MKTYILKYGVYNEITYPMGTIIKPLKGKVAKSGGWTYTFQVVEGPLKGKKGTIAGGLNGWVLENTPKNRKLVRTYQKRNAQIDKEITKMNNEWYDVETVKFD